MRARPLVLFPILALALGVAVMLVSAAGAPVGASSGALPAPRGEGVVHTPGERPAQRSNGQAEPLVVGVDERVRVQDTTAYPFSAVVWLELYNEFDEEIGNCTGTFIGPDAILTAGHCLYDEFEGWVANVAVVPGRDEDYEPFGWDWAANYWVPDVWYDTGGELWDWGIISMGDSTMGETVGWLYIAELSTETLLADDFEPAIAGYPGDASPIATMWFGWKPWFTEVSEFILYHEIDTYAGMSGSAVFSSNLDSELLGAIVGIHVRGDSFNEINEAMRIDGFIISNLDEGCRQMGCTFQYYSEFHVDPTPTNTPVPTPTKAPTVGPLGFRLALPFVGRD